MRISAVSMSLPTMAFIIYHMNAVRDTIDERVRPLRDQYASCQPFLLLKDHQQILAKI